MLKELYELYNRLSEEGEPTLENRYTAIVRPVAAVNIDLVGNYKGLMLLTQEVVGSDGKIKVVGIPRRGPRPVVRSRNTLTNFLVDNNEYVVKGKGVALFYELITDVLSLPGREGEPDEVADGVAEVLAAIQSFACDKLPGMAGAITDDLAEAKLKPDDKPVVTLAVDGVLVWEVPGVESRWEDYTDAAMSPEKKGTCTCVISGRTEAIMKTTEMSRIKGSVGGQSSGAAITSYNSSCLNSYRVTGPDQPDRLIGVSAGIAIPAALNYLLRYNNLRSRGQKTDSVDTLFWADAPGPEKDFSFLTSGFWHGEKDPDPEGRIRDILAAAAVGADDPADDLNVPFYFLTLAGNLARVSVISFEKSSWGEVRRCLGKFFQATALVGVDPRDLAYKSLIRGRYNKPYNGLADIVKSPTVLRQISQAIFFGQRWPMGLLTTLVAEYKRGIHVNVDKKGGMPIHTKQSKLNPKVAAALIKALLIDQGKGDELTVALNRENNNIGYLMGRIFALDVSIADMVGTNKKYREQLQTLAMSQPMQYMLRAEKVRARWSSQASKAKGVDTDMAHACVALAEKELNAITAGIDAFPTHLNTTDQGQWILGYRHELDWWKTPKEKKALLTAEQVLDEVICQDEDTENQIMAEDEAAAADAEE